MLEEFKKKRKEKSSICAKKTKQKKTPAVPTIATGFSFFKMSNFTAEI